MSFLAPAAFAFAAAIPVVVLFYLLKRKRVVKLVSSTMLWQRFLADTQANAPFQKLRHNWLLILQVLLLLLAVFALARPYVAGQAKATRLRVLVLDGSASMQATDVKPARFEAAKAQMLQWIDGLRDGEQLMLLLAGASTEVKQSPTTDKNALRRALQSCAPADAPGRIADALKTAAAFTYEKRGEEEVTSGEIHLFSDGAFPPLDELENKNLPLVYHRVGTSRRNLGVVSLEVRANPENPNQRAVFAGIGNFGTSASTTEVELSFQGQPIETRPVELPPETTQPIVFIVPQREDGVFTVRITGTDDLAADNQASVISLLPPPVKALLVTRGNRFIERALGNLPNVRLTTSPTLNEIDPGFDIVVLDDVTPAASPKANLLAIHVAHTNWFTAWQVVKSPQIVDWKNAHPLLRFVSFDTVQLAEALAVKTPPWGVSLVESAHTPLILAGELEDQRLVWVGFDTLQSTWPLRVSFPIFIANAIDWLNPFNVRAARLLVRAGEAFRFAAAEPIGRADVVRPDGTRQPLNVEPGAREVVFGDTARQGIYRFEAGTNQLTFCVSLLNASESNITPKDELPFGKYAKVTAATLKRAPRELWRWAALGALLILLGEWWYYHKRTV
jgi:hypothetical protein